MLTTSSSPGPHGALLACVQVPDIPGRVNKELKFWQHWKERAEKREGQVPPLGWPQKVLEVLEALTAKPQPPPRSSQPHRNPHHPSLNKGSILGILLTHLYFLFSERPTPLFSQEVHISSLLGHML